MRKATSGLVFLVLLSGFFAIKSTQEVGADESKTDSSAAVVYTTVYRVHDLPVWTAEKMFEPTVLMTLIQSTVSPSEWQAEDAVSTLAPYFHNASLVITTHADNHDKIEALLNSFRPAEQAK
ncbi:MAG: hypothetical protein ACO1RT_03165 [Planctomycetaceae bacterium]